LAMAIRAELSGLGLTSDASHIIRPTVQGQASAQGTETQQNDAVETDTIKGVFGERPYPVPVSSSESMHCQLLGTDKLLRKAKATFAILTSVRQNRSLVAICVYSSANINPVGYGQLARKLAVARYCITAVH